MIRDFTGHGIGETFHSGLYIPHYDNPRLETVMEPGMTFTIEPMITLGTHEYDHLGRRLDGRHQGPQSGPPSSSTHWW